MQELDAWHICVRLSGQAIRHRRLCGYASLDRDRHPTTGIGNEPRLALESRDRFAAMQRDGFYPLY